MSTGDELPSLEELAPDEFLQKLERARRIYSDLSVSFDVERQLLAGQRQAAEARDPVSYEEWEHLDGTWRNSKRCRGTL